ncbi:MAG: 30S ribosomal protein S12 methylthiotransferase RimO [Ruminococcus sp.]|nr:30S ribosomal protein S12 methylthiotransferase RimO [Ruminococcus sp.]MDY3213915.1 30S ribosomal protein S12 methylthiotransferase RimO [Ruminococcus sp.]MDY3843662.1 30S ribosomal protein S12 methylthiotransferase RimO [Ruminococcus sp.]CDF02177.1 ribosomal protein S12 methylthiotransferase RimO [Ruminococcus sp. CAG:624]
MPIKVGMVSLGCSKNLVDSERMLYKLRERGYELVTEPGLADVAVVNTCGFIQSAKEEAIETIIELGKLKEDGTLKKIIITGCLTQRYQEEAAELFPEADAVIGIGDNKDIIDILDHVLANERVVKFSPKLDAELTGERIISTLPFFAYLKVAEGCSNCCTYCAIPQIRGKFRSVPMEEVLKEAQWLAENGVTELIVIAQDTTRYGEDLYGEPKLPELLEKLSEIEGIKWIRTLYCYPERITDKLLETIADNGKLIKYLDIPIQHCNGEILSRMNRWGDKERLSQLMAHIRKKVPDIVLRTTLITGFPGETEEQFSELAEFVQEQRFERLGCFAYSQEEGTKAAEMENQLSEEVKNHRADIIMEQQMLISAANNEKLMGKRLTAVVEGFDKFAECYFGRTEKDAPDIDGKVFFTSENPLEIGDYVEIEISDTLDYDLMGEVVSQ